MRKLIRSLIVAIAAMAIMVGGVLASGPSFWDMELPIPDPWQDAWIVPPVKYAPAAPDELWKRACVQAVLEIDPEYENPERSCEVVFNQGRNDKERVLPLGNFLIRLAVSKFPTS